jgi:hypothetical protein
MSITNTTAYTKYSYNLSTNPSAENNPNLRIAFNCTVGSTAGRACYLDNVTIRGTAMIPVVSNVRNYSISNSSVMINWTTNINTNSTVYYGQTAALGTYLTNSSFVTSRAINLTGLLNATTYYYNITSQSPAGGSITNGTFNFTTLQNSDTTAPVISNVINTSISNSSAVINWTTDELANGTVNYGATLALGTKILNATLVLSHNQNITGLLNATIYYYNITSCDASGNCRTNGTFNFTTLQNANPAAPVVSLLEPANNSADGNGYVIFKYNVTDIYNIINCSLLLNSAVNQTASNIVKNISLELPVSGLSNGDYLWKVSCINSLGNAGTSSERNLSVNNIVGIGVVLINKTLYTHTLSGDNEVIIKIIDIA